MSRAACHVCAGGATHGCPAAMAVRAGPVQRALLMDPSNNLTARAKPLSMASDAGGQGDIPAHITATVEREPHCVHRALLAMTCRQTATAARAALGPHTAWARVSASGRAPGSACRWWGSRRSSGSCRSQRPRCSPLPALPATAARQPVSARPPSAPAHRPPARGHVVPAPAYPTLADDAAPSTLLGQR